VANVHILSQALAFTSSQTPSQIGSNISTETATAEIRLTDATISIHIIKMKTKAALESANERFQQQILWL
jgi:hypothetical protein